MPRELLTRDLIGTVRFAGVTAPLSADEYATIVATEDQALDGNIWMLGGMDLDYVRAFPAVTRDHEADRIIGAVSRIGLMLIAGKRAVGAVVKRLPRGISEDADQSWALVDQGTLRGVSGGIYPLQTVPIDSTRPRSGGLRITRSRLIDVSIVARPSDVNARILLEQQRSIAGRAGAFRSLTKVPAAEALLGRATLYRARKNHGVEYEVADDEDQARRARERDRRRREAERLRFVAVDHDHDLDPGRERRAREADALRLRVDPELVWEGGQAERERARAARDRRQHDAERLRRGP
jgi:hypothetical protein